MKPHNLVGLTNHLEVFIKAYSPCFARSRVQIYLYQFGEAFLSSPESLNLYLWEAQIKWPQNKYVFLTNGPDYLLIHRVHLKYRYLLSNFHRVELQKLLIINYSSLQIAC